MYYDRDYLEARLDLFYDQCLVASKMYIDVGGSDPETMYWDMDSGMPAFMFRSRGERFEYDSIIREWNARFRSEVDCYLREHERAEDRERERAREKAREKEAERLRQEEEERRREENARRREEEERRREEEEERRKKEAERRREEKRKELDKRNREELNRIQEEWKKKAASPPNQTKPAADFLFCPSCGAPNVRSSKFCTKCGTKIQIVCPSCRALILAGAKFCSKCGYKL